MIHMEMVKDVKFGKTMRKSYAKYEEILEIPNMLKIQKDSYQWFLDEGLREVFKDVGTITDFSGKLELSFLDYTMEDKPKYTIEECKERDTTYAKPIKVRIRLRNTETDEIKEQEIFMGDFPVMTNGGTFVINGAERVIISQIVRSPGMYYGHEVDKADQHTYTATVIPYRGAWLEYETDNANVFWVRIDKNRKLPITSLIRALGVSTDQQIKDMFGEDERIIATLEKDPCKTKEESLLEIYRRLRPGEPPTVETATAHLEGLLFDAHRYDVSKVGRYKFNKKMDIWSRLSGQEAAEPISDPITGEILVMPGEFISRAQAHELSAKGVNEAVVRIGDSKVKVFSNNMVDMAGFVDFDPKQYGIKEKVRFSVLREMLETVPADGWKEAIEERMDDLIPKHIIVDDIMASINYLNCVAMGIGTPDDIDHLGNRRLRCVGELLQNQFRIGFSRLDRVIRERMTVQDLDSVTPQSLINIRPVTAVIKEFFGSSPLSQFMDQNNPLAELIGSLLQAASAAQAAAIAMIVFFIFKLMFNSWVVGCIVSIVSPVSEAYADLHIGADNEEEGGKEGNNPERRCHYPDGHLQPSPVRVQTREPEPYEEGVQHYGQRDEYILPEPGAVAPVHSFRHLTAVRVVFRFFCSHFPFQSLSVPRTRPCPACRRIPPSHRSSD